MVDKVSFHGGQGVLPLLNKESYHGGQGVLPWLARSHTMVDKESYHGGQGVLLWWTRSFTMVVEESYHGGQGVSLTMVDKGLVEVVPPAPPFCMFRNMAIWRQVTGFRHTCFLFNFAGRQSS